MTYTMGADELIAQDMMTGEVDVHMVNGYHLVWSKHNKVYTIWKDGKLVGMAKHGEVTHTIRRLVREEMRTHEKPRMLDWMEERLYNMPRQRARRIFRNTYLLIFLAWMVFAVCMFLLPLMWP